MAADDSLGYCCLVQGLCGLVQVFLAPRSGGGLANRPGSSSSRVGRTRSPWDVEIRSDPPVARNSPAVAADLLWSSSQAGRTSSSRVVSPVFRDLRFDHQEEGLSPLARNSPAVAADLLWSSSQAGRTSSSRVFSPVFRDLRFDNREGGLSPLARNSTAVGGDLCSSSSRGVTAGSARDVAAISSLQQMDIAGGVEDDDDDDDDCVILDSDPHSAVTVMGEKEGSAGDGGSDEELQIVAEKGKVACRDFPHSRHLCSNMPFGTTSHEKHCTMCYCFVCDAPAPCSYWGKGLSVDDHCHATDKETKWKTLREASKQRSNGSGTSNGHSAQISHPLALTVSAPRAHLAAGAGRGTSNAHTAQISHPLALTSSAPRASSATRVQSGTSNAHTAQISQPLALTVSAPRASSATRVQSGTSNGHSAQVTHLVEPTASAPRAHPAAGAGRGTSNAHTAQISQPLALTVSAPRASSATRVQSGTSNGHSAQGTHLAEATVSAPRAHPAAGAGRGTSNAHTAQITRPVEQTVSAPTVYPVARTGSDSSNTHTSQITHDVEPTVSATRAYSAARTGRGTSNARTSQIIRPMEQTVSAPGVYPAARAGRDSSNAHSAQITYPATANGYLPEPDAPEGATVYVGNLPYHIDNERLKLSFQQAGVVLFSKIIYDRETGQSRGFGFVTMNNVQEAEAAVRIYHGSVVYGRPLTVKIAAPRGGARVDTTHRQSGSPIRIFVCNLPTQVNHSRLEELFSKHGKVVDARVIYEHREGAWCSRGFGFVTMATEEESYNAIHALNKQVLEGHALGVKVARERPERGCPSPSNQIPPQSAVSQNQNTHTSVRASLNVAPAVSAPGASYLATRARSGTSNAYTAQVTHQLDPTVSAPRPRERRMLPLPLLD